MAETFVGGGRTDAGRLRYDPYGACAQHLNDSTGHLRENAGSISTRVIAPESFQYLKNISDPILNDPAAVAPRARPACRTAPSPSRSPPAA
ncbi:O-glycosyl hydrolase [Nonomuraea thailandensis]|uniref:O-glycosyl hydrolase n=1 Tax=Nonomuraea thailandensis TaxID=1188745 RepID=A0A9X2GF94_9ACTN|nr:hypothetical protein [Nonomuraea thailandensis]MCP2356600.1 O-glycosyl hydrolase [Nonomuraea thailandensis]